MVDVSVWIMYDVHRKRACINILGLDGLLEVLERYDDIDPIEGDIRWAGYISKNKVEKLINELKELGYDVEYTEVEDP
jgi:phosphosulfolactate synthase (CoM biosynthesis protein A)